MCRSAGGELFILSPEPGTLISLNSTGRRIWEFCKDEIDEGDLISRLSGEYGISKDILKEDAEKFLEGLHTRGLIAVQRGDRHGSRIFPNAGTSDSPVERNPAGTGSTLRRLRHYYEKENRPLAFLS